MTTPRHWLEDLEYPRFLHGPDGAHLWVQHVADAKKALAQGWQMTPLLSDEQKAAVRAAKLAAGEPEDTKKAE